MTDDYTRILQRLQQLEAVHQRTTADPHLIQRPAHVALQPYDEFYDILHDAENDFFRSPLSESARRAFLSRCPANLKRRYRAPTVQRSVNVGNFIKRFDQQLADIQYRLFGITRPVDLMAHNSAQGHAPSIPESTDFIRTIHSLLSDVVSHITQLRSDNICRDAGLPIVKLNPNSDDGDSLLDIDRILEQSKLSEALQDAQSKGRLSRKKKGKRNFSGTKTATSDSQEPQPRSGETSNLSSTTARNSTPASTPCASTSSSSQSRGFQRR